MRILINKEIEKEYKDQFMRGFSAKECGFIAVAFICIGVVAYAAERIFHLPINICFYIGIPFGAPAIVVGFATFQGLTFFEYIKELIYEYKTKELYYDASEIKTTAPVFKMAKDKFRTEGKRK